MKSASPRADARWRDVAHRRIAGGEAGPPRALHRAAFTSPIRSRDNDPIQQSALCRPSPHAPCAASTQPPAHLVTGARDERTMMRSLVRGTARSPLESAEIRDHRRHFVAAMCCEPSLGYQSVVLSRLTPCLIARSHSISCEWRLNPSPAAREVGPTRRAKDRRRRRHCRRDHAVWHGRTGGTPRGAPTCDGRAIARNGERTFSGICIWCSLATAQRVQHGHGEERQAKETS